jgi:hypothetical protein
MIAPCPHVVAVAQWWKCAIFMDTVLTSTGGAVRAAGAPVERRRISLGLLHKNRSAAPDRAASLPRRQARAGRPTISAGRPSLLLRLRGRWGRVLGHWRLDRPRRLLDGRWLLRVWIPRRVSRWLRLARLMQPSSARMEFQAISSSLTQDFSLPKATPGSVLRFTPEPVTTVAPRSTRAAGPLPPRAQRQAYRSLLARRLFVWRINRATWCRSTLSASMTFCVTDP